MKNLTIGDLGFKYNKDLENYHYILKPQFCNCGCGGQMCACLDTEDDVYDFLGHVLYDTECDRVMGLAIKRNENVQIMVKWNEEIVVLNTMKFKKFKEELNDLIKEMHCLAIIQETEQGTYRIVHNGIR